MEPERHNWRYLNPGHTPYAPSGAAQVVNVIGTPVVRKGSGTQEDAGTPSAFALEIPASLLAGCTGLEPVASGVTASEFSLGDGGQGSQAVGNTRAESCEGSPVSPRLADIFRPFGIPLVSSSDGAAAALEPLLTVREVAKTLKVSTSTVYQACADGGMAHVRVSNAIRVSPDGLAEYLARREASARRRGPTCRFGK